MGISQTPSSFNFEIKIQQAKGLEFTSTRDLFIRYYLSTGNNRRVSLNTREVSSKSEFVWNETFSLDCFGTEDSMGILKQESVVFELRQRNRVPLLGRLGGSKSKLLGKAEVTWREVMESPNMVLDKWVTFVSTRGQEAEGTKLCKLRVGMVVRVPGEMEMERRKRRGGKGKEECGCRNSYGYCEDYNVFAMASAFE